ncbi:MAG: hypothetical protein PHX04_02680 [Bacilli bacterium]|nr:hypothetical protein [Bacilli bacterium]
MKPPRIDVKLTSEEHQKFKIIVVKKKTSMQKMLADFVRKEIKKEERKNGKN